MAIIQIPVEVLSEHCATCQSLELNKQSIYAGGEEVVTMYLCQKLNLCRYIRNRIVREETNKKEGKDNAE